jgi:hypothetical protein
MAYGRFKQKIKKFQKPSQIVRETSQALQPLISPVPRGKARTSIPSMGTLKAYF